MTSIPNSVWTAMEVLLSFVTRLSCLGDAIDATDTEKICFLLVGMRNTS